MANVSPSVETMTSRAYSLRSRATASAMAPGRVSIGPTPAASAASPMARTTFGAPGPTGCGTNDVLNAACPAMYASSCSQCLRAMMRDWSRMLSTAPMRSCSVPTWSSKKVSVSDRSRWRIPIGYAGTRSI